MEYTDLKRKRIWIVRTMSGNPLDLTQRDERAVGLAKYLDAEGYDVTFFGTAYLHSEKRYISEKTIRTHVGKNEKVVLFHVPIVYKKNTSIKRFIYSMEIAHFLKMEINDAAKYPKPDLIFASYPTENDCSVLIEYAKKNNIPIILDARDQWPDIFERAFPKRLQKIAKFFLWPMKQRTAKVFSKASAICAMSPIQLEWALNYAGRKQSELDKHIFIGCKEKSLIGENLRKRLDEWEAIGVSDKTWNICFFSNLSKTAIDLDTVICAVRKIHKAHPKIRLVVGGKGDEEERLREETKNDTFIHMMGWLNQEQMSSLMSISKTGLLCYRNTRDFKDGWGNKVGQYLSYGLPLLTSAQGFAKTYINQYDCGMAYNEEDVSELVQKLLHLIEHPQEQERLSRNALQRYNADFAYDVVMEQFESMIFNVCEKYISESELRK